MNTPRRLTLGDVEQARAALRPHLVPTPLRRSHALRQRGAWLKLECWQPTGSFKVRGALNLLASLTPAERSRGVVAASAGNHALGVAFAAQALGGIPATLFVPESAPRSKLEKLRAFPVDVRVAGEGTQAKARGYEVASTREEGADRLRFSSDNFRPAGDLIIDYQLPGGEAEVRYWTFQGSATTPPGDRSSSRSDNTRSDRQNAEDQSVAIQHAVHADTRPYVVFAPTNEAFAKLTPAQLDALKADPAQLYSTVYYHMALGFLTPKTIEGKMTSQEGRQLTIKGDGGNITVDDVAKVTCGGITTRNAQIYMIDTVLDPAGSQPPLPAATTSTTGTSAPETTETSAPETTETSAPESTETSAPENTTSATVTESPAPAEGSAEETPTEGEG